MATLVIGVGVLSLVRQSGLRHSLDLRMNIHALFSVLLVGLLLMRLDARRQVAPLTALELSELSRDFARMVYLFLYGVICLRQIIGIADHFLYGGAMGFNPGYAAQKRAAYAGFDPHNDLQAFVAAGVMALVFIRVLLYGMWLHGADANVGYHGSGRADPR